MMRKAVAALVLLWCLVVVPAHAQEEALPVTGEIDAGPAVADLEARVKEIEQDPNLDDLARKALLEPYQEAIRLLGEAEQCKVLEQKFAASLKEGPLKTEQWQAELRTLEETEAGDALPEGLGPDSSTREAEAALAREKAALATLQNDLKSYQEELVTIGKRTAAIGERQVAAKAELAEAKSSLAALAGDASGGSVEAKKARLQALQKKLEAEIAMLEREAASGGIRTSVAETSRDLTAKKIEVARSRVAALQKLATSLMADTLRGAEEAAARIRSRLPDPPENLKVLLADFASLIEETGKVTGAITVAEGALRQRQEELRRLESALEDVRRMSELSGQESTLGGELMEQLRVLPTTRDAKRRASQTGAELAETRGKQFALERTLRDQAVGEALDGSIAEDVPQDLSAEIEALFEARAKLRQDVKTGYKRMVSALSDRLKAEQQIAAINEEYRAFAREQTLLVRTSPPFSADTVSSLPRSLGQLYGAERLRDLERRLAAVPVLFWIVWVLLVGILLAMRPFLGRVLERAGRLTRRISTDNYRHTVVALGATLLMALPVPLVSAAPGLALVMQPDGSNWSFALGGGLLGLAIFFLKISFLIGICRRGGLAEMHFRWDRKLIRRLRRLSWWWIVVFAPSLLTWSLVFGQPGGSYINDVGRIAGMVMATSFGVIIGMMTHPKTGVAGTLSRRSPDALFGRLRIVWFVLVIGLALAIMAMLISGYLFAGLILLEKVIKSLNAVVATFIGYALILRWFSIRERRIAAEERLAEQKARLEARRKQEASGAGSEVAAAEEAPPPETPEEEGLDMTRVGEQTRSLLGFLAAVFLVWRMVVIWSEFGPVVHLLDGFAVLGRLSIADLGIIVLVIAAVVATLRNLPGLLEVMVLRRLGLDAGSRTAFTTLAKYAVIAAGAAFLFDAIGMDWAQFSWIAAALGVGLGFGLQEVVANFVCGIILLFERPVRVGDVVTVDGIDGTVSRIQIRATTITNWDRKDFIVPNKQFVTGTLMNWTLSSGLNRIVINVGVAYGSDTEKVREVLSEVLEGHPDLLDDPPPLVTFEGFGDSSLDFVVRCYLPSLDRRLGIIHELHTAIYRRLTEEGIEIPFPQRDLHIRSGGRIPPS